MLFFISCVRSNVLGIVLLYFCKEYTGWLKKSKLLTQYNSLLFFEPRCITVVNFKKTLFLLLYKVPTVSIHGSLRASMTASRLKTRYVAFQIMY